MLNLFNAVAIFGNAHDELSSATAIFLIIFAQMIILVGVVLLVNFLGKNKKEDTSVAQAQATEPTVEDAAPVAQESAQKKSTTKKKSQ